MDVGHGRGAVVAAPFVALVRRESVQVAWIPPLDGHLPRAVAEYQWFVGAPWFAVLFAVLVVAGSVALVRGHRLPPVLSVALPWIAVPMAALLAYSLLRSPVYLPGTSHSRRPRRPSSADSAWPPSPGSGGSPPR